MELYQLLVINRNVWLVTNYTGLLNRQIRDSKEGIRKANCRLEISKELLD